jgi:predicted DCC family thiol-disulfide oxidoreductase YuxK
MSVQSKDLNHAGSPGQAGPKPARPVLLYDGECGLCNWIVRRMLRSDRAGRLHYAPLQGDAAQAYLRAQGLPTTDFDSLVFVRDWARPGDHAPLLRTDGALAAAAEVGGSWRLVAWLRVLPAGMRDPFYKIVARFRYTLFGEYRPTPLPDPVWAERFL